MTATRKSARFITALALIFAMVLSIASIPVSASGVETWYGPLKTEESFDFYGTNLTPIKTMGVSGELTVSATFVPSVIFTQVNYTLEIRNVSGNTVLASKSFSSALVYCPLSVSLNVTQGQQITVFCSATNASTGEKISSAVIYSHSIS